MPVQRRSTPRFLVVALALPVIAAAYVAFFSRRALSVPRSLVVAILGATVIGSVYAEVAARQAVAPARRAPLPLTMTVALALVLVGSGLPAAPVRAANSHAEAVVEAALSKIGAPYVWAAEGPNVFDCSGLVYWAFKKAGKLPTIGNNRTTAARYMKYFASRGLTSKTEGRRGDLVIFGNGAHIGIYLGDGKVVSALTEGIRVHGIDALHNRFTMFLNVDWTAEPLTTTEFISNVPKMPAEDDPTDDEGEGDPTDSTDSTDQGGDGGGQATAVIGGFAFGSLNLRADHSPAADIIGWVGRGSTFEILATGHSPSGALWYQVRKQSGKTGWIWSHWVRVVKGSLEDAPGD
jgi:hypothetical protein